MAIERTFSIIKPDATERNLTGAVNAVIEKAGLRVETDLRNEKINLKVREHSLTKVPVILVVGKREAEEKKVSVRRLGSQDQTVLGLDEALTALAHEAVPPDLR